MTWIDQLRAESPEYRVLYAWSRAVEWQMLPALISQPVAPVFFLLVGWKRTLLAVVIANFAWTLVFCTAVISLPLAAYCMMWAKLKWLSILGFGIFFALSHEWTLFALTLGTPLILPLVGQIILRRPTGMIQEFMLLTLGLEHRPPSSRVQAYLNRVEPD
jgi:hypothetical protein